MSSLMNWAMGPDLPTGMTLMVWDAFFRVDAAAERASAVDDHQGQLLLGAVGLETVDGSQAGELHDLGQALRLRAAAGDVHDLIALLGRGDGQRAAEAAGALLHADGTIIRTVLFSRTWNRRRLIMNIRW